MTEDALMSLGVRLMLVEVTIFDSGSNRFELEHAFSKNCCDACAAAHFPGPCRKPHVGQP